MNFTIFRKDLKMQVKDLTEEQVLLGKLYERNTMVLDLNNQVINLRKELDEQKKMIDDLKEKLEGIKPRHEIV